MNRRTLFGAVAVCAAAAGVAATVRERQHGSGVAEAMRMRMERRMQQRMDRMPEDFPPRLVRDHVAATRANTDEILELLRSRPDRSDAGGKGEVFKRKDGKWAWHIKAADGRIVATDGGQGYNTRTDAKATVEKVMAGDYTGPIDELD